MENKKSKSLYEHERSKNQPAYEKIRDISFSINEEFINKFVDLMWKGWKKFHPKEDKNIQDSSLKE